LNNTSLNEAVTATQQILNASLRSVATGNGGTPAAEAGQAISALTGNASTEIAALSNGDLQFFIDLANCFELARFAGATFVGMELVRTAAAGLTPVNAPAIAVQNFAVRMALAEEGQILAATTFTSRQQIDNFFDQLNVSFEAAILTAADNFDNVAYQALISLQGAISTDIGTRALTLPTIVSYSFATRMPSLWLAQRIYQDPTRAKQLVQLNGPIHPAFMPASGLALSQ
jgi:prophage DNA circulation protein